jgi:hypothetical protein
MVSPLQELDRRLLSSSAIAGTLRNLVGASLQDSPVLHLVCTVCLVSCAYSPRVAVAIVRYAPRCCGGNLARPAPSAARCMAASVFYKPGKRSSAQCTMGISARISDETPDPHVRGTAPSIRANIKTDPNGCEYPIKPARLFSCCSTIEASARDELVPTCLRMADVWANPASVRQATLAQVR